MPLPEGIVPIIAYIPVEVKDFFQTLALEERRSLSSAIGLILENEYKRRKQMAVSTNKKSSAKSLAA